MDFLFNGFTTQTKAFNKFKFVSLQRHLNKYKIKETTGKCDKIMIHNFTSHFHVLFAREFIYLTFIL